MMMFTADLHLGHENILEHRRAHFDSPEQMDRVLIDNINRKMTRRDVLYVMGDFSFHSRIPVQEYAQQIKPRLVLLRGNHDRDWLKKMDEQQLARCFEGVHEQLSIKKNGIELHMNHYPRLAWSRSHYFAQSFSICGHIHDDREDRISARLFAQVPCQFNAGVDINGFEPVSFEELVRNNIAFYGLSFTREQKEALERAVLQVMA